MTESQKEQVVVAEDRAMKSVAALSEGGALKAETSQSHPFLAALTLLIIPLLLTGCASERYFSVEEDAAARKVCEATGCTIVPNNIMEKFLELARKQRGIGI